MSKVPRALPDAQRHQQALGAAQGRIQVGAPLVGHLRHTSCGGDHAAIDCVARYDAGVVIDANRGRKFSRKLR